MQDTPAITSHPLPTWPPSRASELADLDSQSWDGKQGRARETTVRPAARAVRHSPELCNSVKVLTVYKDSSCRLLVFDLHHRLDPFLRIPWAPHQTNTGIASWVGCVVLHWASGTPLLPTLRAKSLPQAQRRPWYSLEKSPFHGCHGFRIPRGGCASSWAGT